MHQEIKITDDQISLAEGILLPPGKTFDKERVDFIRDLGTFDLHAVPGSGKTTALLAKLIALEQHLPFEDNAGILVLSHTNAAVDEIKNKIGHVCPRLFNYPNCVSTIQSFTDAYLTIPYYKTIHRKRPVRIDDEIYKEHHYPDYKLKQTLGRRNNADDLLYNFRLREGDILKYKLTGEDFIFQKRSETYQKLLTIKQKIRADGFLCFDDAYILAEEYLQKFPRITSIINKRFKYVFVDEMQDMDANQYKLLETLFADAVGVGYQRIGDKNQSIFNDELVMDDIWKERNVKELNGSNRLQPLIAAVVEKLALNPIAIKGQKVNLDGSPINIMPILYVFTNDTKHLVIAEFANEIEKLVDSGSIDIKKDNVFKAIGWTTSKDDDRTDIIKLNHYHSNFSKEQTKLQINYPCLESYLHFYTQGVNKLASIRKSILNGLLKVLRLEGKSNPEDGRAFTKKTFIDHLKTHHPEVEQIFKLWLYKTAKLVAEGNTNVALTFYIKLIKATLKKLDHTISASKAFVYGQHKHTDQQTTEKEPVPVNQFIKGDIVIDIATVHSVKGQTHTGTLYLESFYQKNKDGKGQYESSRIADQLQGIALPPGAHDFIKQTMKMTYVGFSRPTHLLGFGVLKSRYDSHYAGKSGIENWNVKFVTPEIKADAV